VPLVDAALLAATALHLAGGATAGWTHGLAALSLGVSVVFGPTLVRGADARFARRVGAGPARSAAPPPAGDRRRLAAARAGVDRRVPAPPPRNPTSPRRGPMTRSRTPRGRRWAPWWAYLVPILAVNDLRIALVPPGDVGDAVSVALFAATTLAVAVVVTALHRLRRAPAAAPSPGTPRSR
jgi:hypothetical protein